MKISKSTGNIPKVLTVKETGLGQVMQGKFTFARGFEIQLVAVTDNGKISHLYDEKYPDESTFQLGSFNPTLSFQFSKGSKVPLVDIKQIFVGKIKSFDNSTQAIQSGSVFKKIDLNEDTVLKLEDSGPSYMVIDVHFQRNASGIYAVAFDNTPFGDKSTDRMELTDSLKENNWKVVNSSIPETNPGDSFQSVTESVMCHITRNYGFQVCNERNSSQAG